MPILRIPAALCSLGIRCIRIGLMRGIHRLAQLREHVDRIAYGPCKETRGPGGIRCERYLKHDGPCMAKTAGGQLLIWHIQAGKIKVDK